MSDSDLFDAVAQKTGEDSHEIRRRGFMLTGLDEDAAPVGGGRSFVGAFELDHRGTPRW